MKKASKKKSVKDDEDSDVINTTTGEPATQLFKNNKINDEKSTVKRPKNAATNPRIAAATKEAPQSSPKSQKREL